MTRRWLVIWISILLALLLGGYVIVRSSYPRIEVGMSESEIESLLDGKGRRVAWIDTDEVVVSGKEWRTADGGYVITFDSNGRAKSIHFEPEHPSFWHRVRDWLGW